MAAACWLRRKLELWPPVRAEEVARRLGLDVAYKPLSHHLAGMLVPDPATNGYLIVVNSIQPAPRRNFTVAHELGHWVLHRRQRREWICDLQGKGPWEREANQFAAELLMPRAVVEVMAPGLDRHKLARCFGVSVAAVEVRLREIGIRIA